MRLTMGQKQLESNPFPARSAAGPHAMGGIAATVNCMQITSPRHPHVFRFRNFGNHEKTIIIIPELHFPDLGAMLAAADQTL